MDDVERGGELVMRSGYCELPIGPAARAVTLPPGTWTWEAARRWMLTCDDGRTLALPADASLHAEHGLFITGRNGVWTFRPRPTSGAVPYRRSAAPEAETSAA